MLLCVISQPNAAGLVHDGQIGLSVCDRSTLDTEKDEDDVITKEIFEMMKPCSKNPKKWSVQDEEHISAW